MNAAELLVRCLENENIHYIFGVPGEENADFMMALSQSDKIRFILTRHEQGAAFMADVYGRLTGNPAVCMGTLGPGATNLITGVADGNMDRAPMLVLTGQGATSRLHKESHQIMDVVDMFRPVTKWATSIRSANSIPEIVRKAVRIARTRKAGAVHIELPEDVAKWPATAKPMPVRRYRATVPAPDVLDAAAQAITTAQRPIILVGNGCLRDHASQALRQLCQRTGIGVISTFMAKGAVSQDADYCLFTVGLGMKDLGNCALDAADLVITVGFDMVEYHPNLWNSEGERRIIHLDHTPAEIDDHYHPELELVGDLAYSLQEILQRLPANLSFDLVQQQATRQAIIAELNAHQHDISEGVIKPQKVLSDVRVCLQKEGILLSDVGAHKMWIARHFSCFEPNTCLISNGFCSMGFAFPGAIAASLVHPERDILAICGDGGFLMNVQEMETARRLNCRLTVMVWEDGGYGLIAWKQDNEFGHHTELAFGNPNWLQLAQAFGWQGHRITRSQDLQGVLSQALAEDGPSLVVLPIDYRENQKLTQWLGEDLACPIG